MAYRIWLQCPKNDVFSNKHVLERSASFTKEFRIKESDKDGYMLIPTKHKWDSAEIEPAAQDALLKRLFLGIPLDLSEELCIALPEDAPAIAPGTNPIIYATTSWLHEMAPRALGLAGTSIPELLSQCPKRWSIYRPLLLLPTGSFQSQAWQSLLRNVSDRDRKDLWKRILEDVGKIDGNQKLDYLAVNSGIPSSLEGSQGQEAPNVLRSPSGLILLYGGFGPDISDKVPEQSDFEQVLWVSTKQNGVYQTWAPRYTMFSRGNIKEKERIMSFHTTNLEKFPSRVVDRASLANAVAVDLYAGIGYFTFSYAAMGIGKVLCWEINPWSVEALRRGVIENKYGSVRVIKGEELQHSIPQTLYEENRIVVFEEGNENAPRRIEELRTGESLQERQNSVLGDIIHVNCGFLPTSKASWKTAWTILSKTRDGWLHLHENVGVEDIETRKGEIENEIVAWAREDGGKSSVTVEHVEQVKTFAPGVWHCVFDVHVAPVTHGTDST